MWINLEKIFNTLSTDPDVRVVVFTGAGDRGFTSGLDLQVMNQIAIFCIHTNDTGRPQPVVPSMRPTPTQPAPHPTSAATFSSSSAA